MHGSHDGSHDGGHGAHPDTHGAAPGGAHGGASHDAVYVRTIILLTVLTAAEFVLVLGFRSMLPPVVVILGLLAMAGWKAMLVGKVFMHLQYDPRLLKWVAISPLVLATPLYLIASYDFSHGMRF